MDYYKKEERDVPFHRRGNVSHPKGKRSSESSEHLILSAYLTSSSLPTSPHPLCLPHLILSAYLTSSSLPTSPHPLCLPPPVLKLPLLLICG
ncbi:hypothetical protein VZT92_008887 [Zoarces viviparus]|uniref:Uncharacterized protein n=1 Tax=Zoarces viviparus TaxID=48416 RepID=A0AAW1FI28_ZOAVI